MNRNDSFERPKMLVGCKVRKSDWRNDPGSGSTTVYIYVNLRLCFLYLLLSFLLKFTVRIQMGLQSLRITGGDCWFLILISAHLGQVNFKKYNYVFMYYV